MFFSAGLFLTRVSVPWVTTVHLAVLYSLLLVAPDIFLDLRTLINRRSQWLCGLRLGSAAARLLGFEFESHRGHGCLSVVSVVCCQVEVSATG